ncbi:MAG: hypothetical protein E7166_03385 [Firmicutes bacterium]|nr:hypothetical protein [Bacillota bacterium]
MKKDRDMYFENQSYFGNPMFGQPGFQNSQMFTSNAFQMNPYMNMPIQNCPNIYNQNNEISIIEQRLNRMERQIRRLDSRVARLENKLNIDSFDYKSSSDNYNISDSNMYMM